MADEVQIKRWVVLVQKAPIGPLTKEEIRVLLNQKIIRHNDVACLIDPDKKETGWKFLWQFEEFDRRILVDEMGKTIKPTAGAVDAIKKASVQASGTNPPPPERRKENPNPPKLDPESIPLHLRTISPEDLILKSKPKNTFENETFQDPEVVAARHEFNLRIPLAVGGFTFVAVIIAVLMYFKAPQNNGRTPAADSAPVENYSGPTGNGPLSGGVRPIPRRQAPISIPRQAPDPTATREIVSEPTPAPRDIRASDRDRERDRGEIPFGTVTVDDEEGLASDEITEQDIMEAKAFKAKKARNKQKIKIPRALSGEDDEATPSEGVDLEIPAGDSE